MTNRRGQVLVVEDNANMRALVRDILAERHEVIVAADGAAAQAALEAQGIDVVLTDVRMPGVDGFELVRLVKARWPLTEVVMMTAHGSIPAAVEAMRRGAYDYIQKPFDPDDVSLVVARALERCREQRAAAARLGHDPAVERAPKKASAELASLSYQDALAEARDRGSRDYLTALLTAFGGNVSRAAQQAGLERESLHRLLRRHGLRADVFRGPGSGGESI